MRPSGAVGLTNLSVHGLLASYGRSFKFTATDYQQISGLTRRRKQANAQ